jgi:hypothetical protein
VADISALDFAHKVLLNFDCGVKDDENVSYDELLIALRDLLFENNDDARMLKE